MEKKQTAVDFLLNIVIGEDEQGNNVHVGDALLKTEIYNVKQMEKQQIKDAWDNGAYGAGEFMINIETSQEYYNETFKPE